MKLYAKIYHQLTNGINFDAEKVLSYANSNGEDVTKTEIVGRNFTYEDIGKNRLGTNTLFEINKTAGTNNTNKWTTNGMLSSGKGFTSTTISDMTNIANTVDDVINGNEINWGSAIVSATNIFVVPGWKSGLAAIGRGITNFKFW